jgi:hypothetical protein
MTDIDAEIETGTESETESEFEDDVVAKAACGRRSGDGRGTNPPPSMLPGAAVSPASGGNEL